MQPPRPSSHIIWFVLLIQIFTLQNDVLLKKLDFRSRDRGSWQKQNHSETEATGREAVAGADTVAEEAGRSRTMDELKRGWRTRMFF